MSYEPANPTPISSAESSRPSLLALALLIFRITITTFGSGATTIALIGREFEERGWAGRAQFDLCFTLSRVTPGTNVFAFVTSLCWYVRGLRGAIAGLTAMSTPSAIAVLLITWLFHTLENYPLGRELVSGAVAATIGVILSGAWLLVAPRGRSLRTLTLVCAGLLAAQFAPPLIVVTLGGAVGYFWSDPA